MTIKQKIYDIFIIGGGINGVGIANDAATRGLSVGLAEQYDLASGTSSASSKLIHGGLRYLEYYEFRLVREALHERQLLLNKAPHLIKPLSFMLPYHSSMRPAWLMRLGLFLYDHLNRKQPFPTSKCITFNTNDSQNPLENFYKKGFSYTDCEVDDARLVLLNAIQAKEYHADIMPRHKVIKIETLSSCWQLTLMDQEKQLETKICCTVLINATGPWINNLIKKFELPTQYHAQLVKGSHIVVKKLYEGTKAYTLQTSDGRIVFTIPYLDKFTLIGTTDVNYFDNPEKAIITQNEIDYLCQSINEYFKHKITPAEIIWQFSGVRALNAKNNLDTKALSRDYQIELTYKNNLPLLNIFGGKLTTYRALAKHAIDQLQSFFPTSGPSITATLALPGGNITDIHQFLLDAYKQFSFLPDLLIQRYVYSYGTLIEELLHSVKHLDDLGSYVGHGLYQREIEYLQTHEWAKTTDDILWRRTKLGLFFSNNEIKYLENFLKNT